MSQDEPISPGEENEDDDLSLAPPAEVERGEALLPEPAEEPPARPREEPDREPPEEEPPPPRLFPFDAISFFRWPFRGENALDFAASLFVVFLILAAAWVARFLPVLGGALSFAILLTTICYFLTYVVKVARAGAEGRAPPQIWLRPELGEEGIGHGFRLEGLLVFYALLPAILGLLTGIAWLAYPLAVASYGLVPAALLNLAVTGRVGTANPVDALRTARAGGRPYAVIALGAGAVMILVQFLAGAGLGGVFTGILNWLGLVYTALAVGLLARERESLWRRVEDLAGPLPGREDS